MTRVSETEGAQGQISGQFGRIDIPQTWYLRNSVLYGADPYPYLMQQIEQPEKTSFELGMLHNSNRSRYWIYYQ